MSGLWFPLLCSGKPNPMQQQQHSIFKLRLKKQKCCQKNHGKLKALNLILLLWVFICQFATHLLLSLQLGPCWTTEPFDIRSVNMLSPWGGMSMPRWSEHAMLEWLFAAGNLTETQICTLSIRTVHLFPFLASTCRLYCWLTKTAAVLQSSTLI